MYCGISNRDYFIIKVIFSQYNIIAILFTLGRESYSGEQCCSGEAMLLWGGNVALGEGININSELWGVALE